MSADRGDIDVDGVRRVCFSATSARHIRQSAVCEVTSSCGQATEGGLYDPRLGAVDYGSRCATCKHDNRKCPGHFGYIELAVPVFNSHFVPVLRKVVRCVCFECSAACLPEGFRPPIRASEAALQIAHDESRQKVRECPRCGAARPERLQWDKTRISTLSYTPRGRPDDVEYMTSSAVYEVLGKITDKDCRLIGLDPAISRPEDMMFKALPVPPIAVRPPHANRRDDDLTHKLAEIVKTNAKLKSKLDLGGDDAAVSNLCDSLQLEVIHLIDNSGVNGTTPARMKATNRPLKSVATRLKGKEGRIRNNLMGKRVDFSARSVITPEPNISIDELGVPVRIAMTLTFPEVVHASNLDRLERAVRNGPDVYPGARTVRSGDITVSLERGDRRSRVKLRAGDVVERHMLDGDKVLFNRQPSLHRMSMMTHTVRVMPSDTFRLNVLVTECFNADFDGDEMNLHLPQSLATQIEISRLGGVKSQIVSPRHHRPIVSIVQDVALGTFLLTQDGMEVDERTAANVCARCGTTARPIPSTGRELFSSILPRTLHCSAKGAVVDHGDLVRGRVGKPQFQAESSGILHSVVAESGEDAAVRLLNCTQWMACDWLMTHGFSVGARDIDVSRETQASLRDVARDARAGVDAVLREVHAGTFANDTALDDEAHLEERIRGVVIDAGNRATELARRDGRDSDSRLLDMVDAKSKGNDGNVQQMMGMLGQNYVDYARMPVTCGGRSLPHFKRFDQGADARGFIGSSFRSGLNPHEFFFHAMAGREGLIDTAVKTAESGYIQRKLVKALEDLKVVSDLSVRSATNRVISFRYGGDGMDPCRVETQKIPSFDSGGIEGLAADYLLSDADDDEMALLLAPEALRAWRARSPEDSARLREHFADVVRDKHFADRVRDSAGGTTHASGEVVHAIAFDRIITSVGRAHSPVAFGSDLVPTRVLDVAESLIADLFPETEGRTMGGVLIRAYLSPKRLVRLGIRERALADIQRLVRDRFLTSIVSAGEMVGIIAAQSIAETSTQMVLNSFHQAGTHDEGGSLPRIKDLISASKNPKRTVYRIRLLPGMDESEDFATVVRDSILCTHVRDVVVRTTMLCENGEFAEAVDERVDRLASVVRPPTHPAPDRSSPVFVLRLEISRSRLAEHGIGMLDVHRAVHAAVHADVAVSDDASASLVVRVTPDLARAVSNGADVVSELRAMESAVLSLLIKGVPGVETCTVQQTPPETKEYDPATADYVHRPTYHIQATGGAEVSADDIHAIVAIPGVDASATRGDNLCHVAAVYGIEGARHMLLREFQASYSDPYADFRHLELLADYMTHRGRLTAIASHGIKATDAGPLSKCSFEQTVPRLVEAAVFGDSDDVSGVSANIMLGQTTPCGSGHSTVVWDVEADAAPRDSDDVVPLASSVSAGRMFTTAEVDSFVAYTAVSESIPVVSVAWPHRGGAATEGRTEP